MSDCPLRVIIVEVNNSQDAFWLMTKRVMLFGILCTNAGAVSTHSTLQGYCDRLVPLLANHQQTPAQTC